MKLPKKAGKVFISVKDDDKPAVVDLARRLRALGYSIVSTSGTHRYLTNKGVPTELVLKVAEGRPNSVDKIVDGEINLVINTTFGRKEIADSFSIRRETLMHGIPYYTTVQAGRTAVEGLEALAKGDLGVKPLQDYLKAGVTKVPRT
jgi:carbamoyl-phosphate synthase large subunit